jgi:hypothetical protein
LLEARLIKGKFDVAVVGAAIKVTCKSCGQAAQSAAALRAPDATDQDTMKQLVARVGDAKAKKRVPALLDELKGPEAAHAFLVAPTAEAGRIEGLRPVICPSCRGLGLIFITRTRTPTTHLGVVSREINCDAAAHPARRAFVSYVVLRAIDAMALAGTVSRTAHVVCPGASLQDKGRSTTGYEDAHQLLREVVLDGQYVYELADQNARQTLIYCHGCISHLPAIYNKVDCLIEQRIVADYVDLVRQIVTGSLRRQFQLESSNRKVIWSLLCIRYYYAVRAALIDAQGEPEMTTLLNEYASRAQRLKDMVPGYVDRDFASLCASLQGEFRTV